MEDFHVDAYQEEERFAEAREPFTWRDEGTVFARAAVYGDREDVEDADAARWRYRWHQERDREFWRGREYLSQPLTSDVLRALVAHDAQWDRRRPTDLDFCELSDGHDEDDLYPADNHQVLEALGRRLYEKDPTIWRELRRFGPTDKLLARANALLTRPQRTEGTVSARPTTCSPARVRQSNGRPRERRDRARRRATARAGPDDGPSEPASRTLAGGRP